MTTEPTTEQHRHRLDAMADGAAASDRQPATATPPTTASGPPAG